MSGPRWSSQASATCAGVHVFAAATRSMTSSRARLRERFSCWKRGNCRRRSLGGRPANSRILPLRKPGQRTVGHEPDAELPAEGQDLRFDVADQREYSVCRAAMGWTAWARRIVWVPPRRGRGGGPCPAAPGGHGAHGVLDGDGGVHPVEVVEVDRVHLQPLQARLARLGDVLGAPVLAHAAVGRRKLPNLVASTTCARRPASALPTSSSLWPARRRPPCR